MQHISVMIQTNMHACNILALDPYKHACMNAYMQHISIMIHTHMHKYIHATYENYDTYKHAYIHTCNILALCYIHICIHACMQHISIMLHTHMHTYMHATY
jgi:hypothetical protein